MTVDYVQGMISLIGFRNSLSGKNSLLITGVKSNLCINKKRGHGSGLESVGVCQKEEEGENRGQPRPVGSMLLRAAYTCESSLPCVNTKREMARKD